MSMAEYLSVQGAGDSEITEKRSRFIGRVIPATTEDAARAEITRIRALHHDARHSCWCYIVRDGGILRYSDDGEPQGSAGLPMLEVFRRGGIEDVCCVVTRYFGGVLLGTGGLSRAYSDAARLALDCAGTVKYVLLEQVQVDCPYNLIGKIRAELEAASRGLQIEYGEAVTLRALVPDGASVQLGKRIMDLTAGDVTCIVTGKQYGPEV